MKATFTCFLAFLFSTISYAQIFEHHEDLGSRNEYTDIINVGDSMWVVSGISSSLGSFASGNYLKAFDTSGSIIWEYAAPLDVEARDFLKIKLLNTNEVLVFGSEQWCCDCSEPFVQFHKFSLDGELITQFDFEGLHLWEQYREVAVSDTLIVFGAGAFDYPNNEGIVAATTNGDSLWAVQTGGSIIRNVLSHGENFIGIIDSSLVRVTSSGDLMDTLSFSQPIIDAVELDQSILILLEDGAYEIDQSLNTTLVIENPLEETPRFLHYENQHFLFWFEDVIYEYDINYDLTATTSFDPLPGHEVRDVSSNQESFAMVGWRGLDAEFYYSGSYRGASILSFEKDGTQLTHSPDLAFKHAEAELIDAWVVWEEVNVHRVVSTITGYLVNEGNTEIDEASLNYYSFGICNPSGNRETYSNLSLQPGDSVEVSIDAWWDQPATSGEPITVDYCVFLSDPSHFHDRVRENDYQCASVVYVGVDEIDSPDFSLFPNPTSDWLNLEFEGTSSPEKIEIRDLSGRIVRKITPGNENGKARIDVSSLPAGIYLLQITSSENSVSIEKFVVE